MALVIVAMFAYCQIEVDTNQRVLTLAEDGDFNSNASLASFQSDFHSLRSRWPAQTKRSWAVVSAAVKSVLKEEPSQPAVLMLVHSNGVEEEAAKCLAMELVGAAARVLDGGDGGMYPTELHLADTFSDRTSLHEAAERDLGSSRTFVLHNLHELRGSAAMALHSFCDNINAPFKRAVIVLTIQAGQGDEEGNLLDEAVEEALVKAWSQDLDADKIHPLLSRISVSTARVEPEVGAAC